MILAPGDPAPGFRVSDQYGADIHLAEVAGRSVVILVFLPFAFSPICGDEIADLDRQAVRLREQGAAIEILAVTCDSKYTLAAWAEAKQVRIPLLSDFWPHGAISASYGVLDEAHGVAERGVFVISRTGTIESGRQVGRSETRDFTAEIDRALTLV